MKKIIYSLFTLSVLFLFGSCEKDSQDTSKITHFVSLEIKGSSIMAVPLGGTYVEPGYEAELKGENFTSEVQISGKVDENKIGIYTLTYWALNEDNMRSQQIRRVCVYDPTDSEMESGGYRVLPTSYRNNGGTITAYGGNFSVIIYQIEPGIFAITDFLGGWYDQRAAYGPAYAMMGEFILNNDNTIDYEYGYVPAWDDNIEGMDNSFYEPADKTIHWTITYAGGMEFIQELVKE